MLTLASLSDTVLALERILGPIPVLILVTDRAGRILESNAGARDAFARTGKDLQDRPIGDLVPGLVLDLDPVAPDSDAPPAVRFGSPRRRGQRADGGGFPVEVHASAHRLGDDLVCVVALLDMTERLQADRSARESRALLDAVLDGLPAMVSARAPDGTYAFVNAYQADVFGTNPADAVGRTAADLLGGEAGHALDAADRRIAQGTTVDHSGAEALNDAEGRRRVFMTTRAALRDTQGHVSGVLSVGIDVTHATAAEERLERLALMDDLTGLPNRTALPQLLDAQIRAAGRSGTRTGLVVITVTNLHDLASEFGDSTRTAVLRWVGIRLGAAIAEGCVLARLDDDAFAAALPDLADSAALERRAADLVDRASRPVMAQGLKLPVSCRAGLALYPDNGRDAAALIRAAQHGLRAAPGATVVSIRRSADQVETYLKARRAALSDLRRDLEHDRLQVRFRPIAGPCEDSVVATEACLVDGSERILVPDASDDREILSWTAARAEGLGAQISERLVRRACHLVARWTRPLALTIPLTRDSWYQPDLAEMIDDAIESCGLPRSRLTLSVEESDLADDPVATERTMEELAGRGFGLSIAGFGTAGLPLLSLPRLPIRQVIFSEHTVSGLPGDRAALRAAESAAGLARGLGLSIAAQGVTVAEQRTALEALGCGQISGPLIGAMAEETAARRWGDATARLAI